MMNLFPSVCVGDFPSLMSIFETAMKNIPTLSLQSLCHWKREY